MNQHYTSFQDFRNRYPIRPNDEGALLGSGSYGRVIKVEDQLETEWVAIKISEFKGNDTKSLKAEVELARRVPRQANIARYDACYRLETDTSVSDFAIMKYYPDGNLADLMRRQTVTPTQIYDLTKGILLGLQHLHQNRIVHRDFKPANILISRDNAGRFIPKIADFGLSKLVSDDELDSSDFDLSDGRGTPSYKAPEQIEGSRVSFNLDLWAFGVILYEMLTGEKPFRSDLRNSSEQSVRREIEKKIMSVELPERLNQIAEPYQTMIRRCLVRDIHERVRKEAELLDLLDAVPQLLAEARRLVNKQRYQEALAVYEQVLGKRNQHTEAQLGVKQCKEAILKQQVDDLLVNAGQLLVRRQFDDAKKQYEQALLLVPNHDIAQRGVVECMEQLRPKPKVVETEKTDVYQEELTDAYVPFLEGGVAGGGPERELPVEGFPLGGGLLADPVAVSHSGAGTAARPLPWRIIVPVVIGLGAGVFYLSTSGSKTPVKQPNSKSSVLPPGTIDPGKKTDSPVLTPSPEPGVKPRNPLTARVDALLSKARKVFQLDKFDQVLALTNSALQLDPTRKDVLALQSAAMNALKAGTLPVGKSPEPTTVQGQSAPLVEESKPKEPVEDANARRLKEKQQQQDAYDQLIEEGIKAIANGNNKAKAIASFSKAQTLAKEQELNTAKADAAYTSYMAKANKIFATDEFEGAMEWYLVVRSLKDTEEVRRKIKQSTNQ